MTTKWKILNKYDFELIPGEAKKIDGAAESYYEYLNGRPNETGKNVQCVAWLLEGLPQGLRVVEPFGGCGVFSVAIQELLKPSSHLIYELDEGCIAQLDHALRDYNALIYHGDARQLMGYHAADVYVCDFPFFTYLKLTEQKLWLDEMKKITAHGPRAILVTDGSAYNWHLNYKRLQSRGHDVNASRESYAYMMSDRFSGLFGYHVSKMAYHNTCFYMKLEMGRRKSDDIQIMKLGPGTGPDGLRRV